MDKFNFISEPDLRINLERDYKEMHTSLNNSCNKSVLILAGSIIEAILVDYLLGVKEHELNERDVLGWDLNKLIQVCDGYSIISKTTKNLSDVVRNYRNLIHPGRQVRTRITVDTETATIANSLVEIILKEIRDKKQEAYGYTGEQIISKIQSDSTSDVIWHYFIKDLNEFEKKRLLLDLIISRYFEVLYDTAWGGENSEGLYVLSRFFKSLFKAVNETIQRLVAENFLRILKEGDELEVRNHIDAFFLIEYLNFYEGEELKMVKAHLFGFLRYKLYSDVVSALSGITLYFDQQELDVFSFLFISKAVFNSDEYESNLAKRFLSSEYSQQDEQGKSIIQKAFSEQIKLHQTGSNFQKIKDLLEYISDDLPF